MTPDEEVDAMFAMVETWPSSVEGDNGILVEAGHEMLQNEIIKRAARYLMCKHPLSAMIRTPVGWVVRSIDSSVEKNSK
jgi:hypothetical protein